MHEQNHDKHKANIFKKTDKLKFTACLANSLIPTNDTTLVNVYENKNKSARNCERKLFKSYHFSLFENITQ